MEKYCQFCPVAKAAEILCEKWAILVLRELMMGSTRFSQLRRGLPKISPSILSRRLKALEQQDVIVKRKKTSAGNYDYLLTDSGKELRPIILGFGAWGHKWAKNKITKEDLDAGFLLWDMRRRLQADYFGDKRVVIYIEFSDQKKPDKYWWMVIEKGAVDLCFEDMGHEPDIIIITTLPVMTRLWLGYEKFNTMLDNGRLKLLGPGKYLKSIARWIGRSTFANDRL